MVCVSSFSDKEFGLVTGSWESTWQLVVNDFCVITTGFFEKGSSGDRVGEKEMPRVGCHS